MAETLDHYRLEEQIGQGGMGTVYRATDLNLQRQVAIKLMQPNLASRQDFQQRFLQEARAAASLDHPNIVKVLYFGLQNGQPFLVMDLILGGSLRDYIDHLYAQQKYLDLLEVTELARQISDALNYAHQQGMVHRDIKPGNILLKQDTRSGASTFQAVITDFGLAKLNNSLVESVPGQTMGTFAYMSPEQCLGQDVDGRTDIYSLGVMLYELVVGRLPFQARTLTEAIRMHTNDPLPDPNVLRPGLPASLVQIIVKSLAKRPEDRFQTAGEMSRSLQSVNAELARRPTNLPEASGGRVDSLGTYLTTHSVLPPAPGAPGTPPPGGFPSLSQRPTVPQATVPQPPAPPGNPTVPVPPSGGGNYDQIVISSPNDPTRTVPITKDVFIIGRESTNDIVLSSEQISRNHSRIEKRPDGTYTLADLGSTNGTYLNEVRLTPGKPQAWTFGQPVRVGDFRLSLEAAKPIARPQATREIRTVPQVAAPTVAPVVPPGGAPTGRPGVTQPSAGKVSILIAPTTISVKPGTRSDMTVEVANNGTVPDQYVMQIGGLPPEWITTPTDPLQLPPGSRGTLLVNFQPPTGTGAAAGQYPFQVMVSSKGVTNANATATGALQIEAYSDFTVDLQPRRLTNAGNTFLSVVNNGNAPNNFAVVASDAGNLLNLTINQPQFSLQPAQKGEILIQVAPKQRPLIGGSHIIPFEVAVQAGAQTDRPQTQEGELLVTSTIPLWAVASAAVLVVILGIIGLLVLSSLNSSAGQNNSVIAQAETDTQAAVESLTPFSGANSISQALTDTQAAMLTQSPAPLITPIPTLTPFFGPTDDIQGTFNALNAATQYSAALTQTVQAFYAGNAATITELARLQATFLANQSAAQTATAQFNGAVFGATQTAAAQFWATQTAFAQNLGGQTAVAMTATAISAFNQTQIALQTNIAANQTALALGLTQTAAFGQSVGTQTAIANQIAAINATQTAIANSIAIAQTQTAIANQIGATQTAIANQTNVVGTLTAIANQQNFLFTQTAAANQAAANATQTTIANHTAVAGTQTAQAITNNQTQTAAAANQAVIASQTASALSAKKTATAAANQAIKQTQTAIAANNQAVAQTQTAAAANQGAANATQTAIAAANIIKETQTAAANQGAANTTQTGAAVAIKETQTAVAGQGAANATQTAAAAAIKETQTAAANQGAANATQTGVAVAIKETQTAQAGQGAVNATQTGVAVAIKETQTAQAGQGAVNATQTGVAVAIKETQTAAANGGAVGGTQTAVAGMTQTAQGGQSSAPVYTEKASPANSSANKLTLNNTLTNGQPNPIILITQNYTPGGQPGGAQDPRAIGVGHDPNKWYIFNQDNAAMPANAGFNIQIASGNAFVHTASAGNTTGNETTLDNPLTNNNPNAILIVTQNYNPGGAPGTGNNQAVGVNYSANKWHVFNEHATGGPAGQPPIPANASFNVEVFTAGPDAFVATATAANLIDAGNVLPLDNPFLNGNPNAVILVSQNWNPGGVGGVYNPQQVGVFYDTSINKWVVFNEYGSPAQKTAIPVGASFNVAIVSH